MDISNDNINLRMQAIRDVKIGNISREALFSCVYLIADILGGKKPQILSVRMGIRLFTKLVNVLFYLAHCIEPDDKAKRCEMPIHF